MKKRKNIRRDFFAREHSRFVIMGAESHHQRTGQYLFNGLPVGARDKIVGNLWDPFYKEMSQYEIERWLNDHIIFNDRGKIIGLINNNEIIWEDKYG